MSEIPRLGVLASGDPHSKGGGSTLEAVLRDVRRGAAPLDIGAVICNNPPGSVAIYDKVDAYNAGVSLDKQIPVFTINSKTDPGRPQPRGQTLDESAKILRRFKENGVEFVIMLGYAKVMNGDLIDEWGWKPEYGYADPNHNGLYHPNARIANNHPGILPYTAGTWGPGTHTRAFNLYRDHKLTHTAFTIHLASAEPDGGPVIHETMVKIGPFDTPDTIEDKVRSPERSLTAPAIADYLMRRSVHLQASAA